MSERRPQTPARRNDADIDALGRELNALPQLEPPPDLWRRLRGRLDEDAKTPQRRIARTALAAGVGAVAVSAAVVFLGLSGTDTVPGSDASVARHVEPQEPSPDDAYLAAVEALLEQSRRAERHRRAVLAFYSPTATPERILRHRIGGIDAALNEQLFVGEVDRGSRQALLRDRVALMADLTDIERYRQHQFIQRVSY